MFKSKSPMAIPAFVLFCALASSAFAGDNGPSNNVTTSLSVSAKSCANGLCSGDTVYGHNDNDLVGQVTRVFDNGKAEVKWTSVNGDPATLDPKIWDVYELDPQVSAVGGFAAGDTVYGKNNHGDFVGQITRVFDNGKVEINWTSENGKPFSGGLSIWDYSYLHKQADPSADSCAYENASFSHSQFYEISETKKFYAKDGDKYRGSYKALKECSQAGYTDCTVKKDAGNFKIFNPMKIITAVLLPDAILSNDISGSTNAVVEGYKYQIKSDKKLSKLCGNLTTCHLQSATSGNDARTKAIDSMNNQLQCYASTSPNVIGNIVDGKTIGLKNADSDSAVYSDSQKNSAE